MKIHNPGENKFYLDLDGNTLGKDGYFYGPNEVEHWICFDSQESLVKFAASQGIFLPKEGLDIVCPYCNNKLEFISSTCNKCRNKIEVSTVPYYTVLPRI